MSHTLYLIYDETGKITDYVVDNVDTTKNFISYVHGSESFINSVVNNLKAFLNAHNDVRVESNYIIAGRHGSFDTTYGKIEDNQIEGSSTSSSNTTSSSNSSNTSSSESSSSGSSSNASSDSSTTPTPKTTPSNSSTAASTSDNTGSNNTSSNSSNSTKNN